MSLKYDDYLKEHRSNVLKGWQWITEHIDWIYDVTNSCDILEINHNIEFCHDYSKDSPAEYDAYDEYFYGGNRSYRVVADFREAWLIHIHNNPHHWQHWVLINDEPNEGEIALDMPIEYVIEMICDWWAFSWKSGNLNEIFDWYDQHKDYIKLSKTTRDMVEHILQLIKAELEEEK